MTTLSALLSPWEWNPSLYVRMTTRMARNKTNSKQHCIRIIKDIHFWKILHWCYMQITFFQRHVFEKHSSDIRVTLKSNMQNMFDNKYWHCIGNLNDRDRFSAFNFAHVYWITAEQEYYQSYRKSILNRPTIDIYIYWWLNIRLLVCLHWVSPYK